MRRMLAIVLMIGLSLSYGTARAQTGEQSQDKKPLKFELKEPKVEKKSAVDMGKTMLVVGGSVALGVGVAIIAGGKGEPDPGPTPSNGSALPTPPDFPTQSRGKNLKVPFWLFGK